VAYLAASLCFVKIKAQVKNLDPASEPVIVVEMPLSPDWLESREDDEKQAIVKSIGEAVYDAAERCSRRSERKRAH
jgi:copper chaperone CopZ